MTTPEEKLKAIAAILGDSTSEQYAWMNKPIGVEQAVIDGKTFNRDGSVWDYDVSGRFGGQEGVKTPVCTSYGYFSAEKDPETHARLLQLFGQHYQEWYDRRDPWSIYKVDISDMVSNGTVNWINFSWLMQPYTRFVQ